MTDKSVIASEDSQTVHRILARDPVQAIRPPPALPEVPKKVKSLFPVFGEEDSDGSGGRSTRSRSRRSRSRSGGRNSRDSSRSRSRSRSSRSRSRSLSPASKIDRFGYSEARKEKPKSAWEEFDEKRNRDLDGDEDIAMFPATDIIESSDEELFNEVNKEITNQPSSEAAVEAEARFVEMAVICTNIDGLIAKINLVRRGRESNQRKSGLTRNGARREERKERILCNALRQNL